MTLRIPAAALPPVFRRNEDGTFSLPSPAGEPSATVRGVPLTLPRPFGSTKPGHGPAFAYWRADDTIGLMNAGEVHYPCNP